MSSMLQRCHEHDYRARCIYQVTVSVAGHEKLLGRLAGNEWAPRIELSPFGEIVAACWREVPTRFPGVRVLAVQVMPDHFHGVVFVETAQAKHLGAVVGFIK